MAYFADVDVTHPHFHAIESLHEQDVIEGYQKDDFFFYSPLKPVLRAEAMKVLLLSSNIEIQEELPQMFDDVSLDVWFAPYVNTAAKQGIVKGFSDGDFHPAAHVSRAEFLKMLILTFDVPVREEQEGEEWYTRFFEAAREWNLIDSNQIQPQKSVTRGELAESIYRTQKVHAGGFQKKYIFSGAGQASYYNEGFAGNNTASGEIYDPTDLTAAHRTLPFGTYLKVFHGDKFVIVRINDRGPYHSKRILDLSQRAFEMLAPSSRGVIDIDFEIVSGPTQTKPAVPEYIRPEFSAEVKNAPVPSVVSRELNTDRDLSSEKTIPVFDETIVHLSEDFFPHALLRRTIPQKIVEGTVFLFSGRAKQSGHNRAKVFLQELSSEGPIGDQVHFEGPISGKNFSFPIRFLNTGKYYMGLVFDDEKRSRVAEIEVVELPRKRHFSFSDETLSSDLDIRILPENSEIYLQWESDEERVSKILFSQSQKSKTLFVEDGLDSLMLPYDFFDAFSPDQKIRIELFQALSQNGTLDQQISNWISVVSHEYQLKESFPDGETEAVSVFDFPRFLREIKSIVLEGRLEEEIQLAEHAFLTLPNGFVREIPIQMQGGYDFRFRIQPEAYGRHILEIINDQGEILFNRAMYIFPHYVLPIIPESSVDLSSESVSGVRHWTNVFRSEHGIPPLAADVGLNAFAQRYAEQMADENFISHTSPTGLTFEQRVKQADLQGDFGENLSYASDLHLALAGLKNSGSHRKSMLQRKWTKVGIGIAQNEKGEYYVVQIFEK